MPADETRGGGDRRGRRGHAGRPAAEHTVPCYDRACRLLGLRPHFRAELTAKLARRGYPRPEIEQALERLAREGWLDDAAAARGLVASRLARGAEGRPRLRAELERRGAPPDAVAAALDELPEDDLPAAREAARRWHGKSAAALARHLARKGFSRRAIFAVLKEHPDLAAEGADPDLP
ncbi:MAG TPA: regulatory protein RecX [Thermoanaerobaculia bacterium]